ncbi:adenine phosphoribosyltransferase [Pseudofrancisella aestuarii]|uniref:Adenine phosphoribosyltransferase n=1 Tax=Pseudofrancisella aestuarii TaxID=2670347 RepID=A0ABV9TBW7_9GAMM|nr:adenine phosphoribosyltransferase [Pseudofrancisella aestuarii]
MSLEFISSKVAAVQDFPKKGIVFRDITPLLADPNGLKEVSLCLVGEIKKRGLQPTIIAGAESRGFIFGVALAEMLGLGFVPIRKPGKLPRETYSVSYELEYGKDTLEIHKDAFKKDDRVLIIDDLLATGGTAKAAAELVEKAQAKVEALMFVIELDGLNGRKKLGNYNIASLLSF